MGDDWDEEDAAPSFGSSVSIHYANQKSDSRDMDEKGCRHKLIREKPRTRLGTFVHVTCSLPTPDTSPVKINSPTVQLLILMLKSSTLINRIKKQFE